MSGAGLVLATIRTAAKLKLQHNIVGCMACVENMISGNSYRPGDVLQSLSGKTVEVLNTDAEGRLILADALTYMQQNFELSYLLDFATLTGAIVVALGEFTSGWVYHPTKGQDKELYKGKLSSFISTSLFSLLLSLFYLLLT